MMLRNTTYGLMSAAAFWLVGCAEEPAPVTPATPPAEMGDPAVPAGDVTSPTTPEAGSTTTDPTL